MEEHDSMEQLRNDYRRFRKKMIYNKLEEARFKEIAETVSKYFEDQPKHEIQPKITLVDVSHTNITNYFGRDDVKFYVTLHVKRAIFFNDLLELKRKLSEIGLLLIDIFPMPYQVILALFERCEKPNTSHSALPWHDNDG